MSRPSGLLVFALAWVLSASCAGPGPNAPNPDSASGDGKESDLPVKSVTGKGPEITATSEDGHMSYVIRADKTQVEVGEGGASYGTLEGVTGEIKRDGQVKSRFKAPAATLDRTSQTLLLTHGATFTGETEGLVLKATSVKYDQGRARIEAEGNVTVTSDAMVYGPLPKLWATPDLKKIATPGKFK